MVFPQTTNTERGNFGLYLGTISMMTVWVMKKKAEVVTQLELASEIVKQLVICDSKMVVLKEFRNVIRLSSLTQHCVNVWFTRFKQTSTLLFSTFLDYLT